LIFKPDFYPFREQGVGKRKTVSATTGVRRNCFGERPRRNARVLEGTLPRSPLNMSMTTSKTM